MLELATTRKGYAIAASDGHIGTLRDMLFDDRTWRVRWLVIDTGDFLPGRRILLHPSAIGTPDDAHNVLSVTLSMAEVRASPSVSDDEPVSRQLEVDLHGYYGWDPVMGGGYYGGGAIASPLSPPPFFGGPAVLEAERHAAGGADQDPHLQSLESIQSCHIEAEDGEIGHLHDAIIDDSAWTIAYLILATRNWWPGRHVLISPDTVRDIDWPSREINVALTRAQIKSSPPWETTVPLDPAYRARLHAHYGWHTHGWGRAQQPQ